MMRIRIPIVCMAWLLGTRNLKAADALAPGRIERDQSCATNGRSPYPARPASRLQVCLDEPGAGAGVEFYRIAERTISQATPIPWLKDEGEHAATERPLLALFESKPQSGRRLLRARRRRNRASRHGRIRLSNPGRQQIHPQRARGCALRGADDARRRSLGCATTPGSSTLLRDPADANHPLIQWHLNLNSNVRVESTFV